VIGNTLLANLHPIYSRVYDITTNRLSKIEFLLKSKQHVVSYIVSRWSQTVYKRTM